MDRVRPDVARVDSPQDALDAQVGNTHSRAREGREGRLWVGDTRRELERDAWTGEDGRRESCRVEEVEPCAGNDEEWEEDIGWAGTRGEEREGGRRDTAWACDAAPVGVTVGDGERGGNVIVSCGLCDVFMSASEC